jgi:hypothetical protein
VGGGGERGRGEGAGGRGDSQRQRLGGEETRPGVGGQVVYGREGEGGGGGTSANKRRRRVWGVEHVEVEDLVWVDRWGAGGGGGGAC